MTAPVVMSNSEKIAMTAPVVMSDSEKIAMTAPVVSRLQLSSGALCEMQQAGSAS